MKQWAHLVNRIWSYPGTTTDTPVCVVWRHDRPEQISKMSPKTITHIVKNHEKALKILHILKAKKLYKNETNLVNSIFPHAQIGNSDNDWLIKLPKDATLKKLGISTKEIVDEFIQRKMLPIDFYNLSTDTVKL